MHFSFGGWAGVRFHHAVLFVFHLLSLQWLLSSLLVSRWTDARWGGMAAIVPRSPPALTTRSRPAATRVCPVPRCAPRAGPEPRSPASRSVWSWSGCSVASAWMRWAEAVPLQIRRSWARRSLARCRASRMDRSSVRPTSWTTRRWPRGTTCTARTVWARSPHPITRAARTHCCRTASAAPAAQTSLMCSSTPDTPRRPGSISSSWSQLSSTCTCRRRMPRRSASTTTCRTCCLKPRVSRTNYFTVFSAAFQNFTHKFCCLSDSFQKPWQVKVLCVSSWKDFKQCYMLNQVAVQGNSCRLTCCLLWFIFTICIIFSVLYLKHSHQNNK